MAKASRPLSPHLQIFRWYFTMTLSIAHRATGIGLALGLLLLTWWLVAMAGGPDSFAGIHRVVGSWFGGLVLFVYSYVVYHHLCSGIRHLLWDAGFGFELTTARLSGQVVILAAAGLTLFTWLVFLLV